MQFINPLFLIGLSAAVLPVIYHLIRRMQAKRVPFGSVMFLKATPKQVVRKRRLRDLLLMAVRAFMFALLALVFARPFFPDARLPFASSQEDRSIVLLVDVSYSMQYGDLFEQARREVLRLIDEAGPGDEIAILAFSNQVRQVTEFSTDRALLRGAAGAIAVSNRPGDFYRPLQRAEEVLQEARNSHRSVVLISDFQKSGWESAPEDWKLAAGISFVPVKLTRDDPYNAFVEAFELRQQRSGNQVNVRFDARVSAPRAGEAALVLDGQLVERLPLDSRLTFQRQATRDGYVQGEIVLPEDDLPVDDRYYFTYAIRGRPSILMIDGVSGGTSRDAFFLGSALNLGDEGRYAFVAGGTNRLTRVDLRPHDLVVLSNVPSLNRAQLDALDEYLERGGSVVLSFGSRSELPAYAAALRDWGAGSLSASPLQDHGSSPAIIGEVDLRHPVFNVFTGSVTTVILRPTFRRYVQITPDSSAAIVARFDSGDPFLIESRVGGGRLFVYTSTFNTDWTDFPLQEMYVPFLYQLVSYALSSTGDRRMFQVGDAVPLRGNPGSVWEIRAPGDRLFRVEADEKGEAFFRETEFPGHYAVAGAGERSFFSVNLDPAGSVLETRDVEEAYAAVVDVAQLRELVASAPVAADEQDQKLWKYLLLLVIALFVLESFLANRRTRAVKAAVFQPPVRARGRQPVSRKPEEVPASSITIEP